LKVKCIDDTGYPRSLILNKIYTTLEDEFAELMSCYRVFEESQKNGFLFPKNRFEIIKGE